MLAVELVIGSRVGVRRGAGAGVGWERRNRSSSRSSRRLEVTIRNTKH